MSRSYTDDDRMVLIARHYYVLNISQVASTVGSFMFVAVILTPLTKSKGLAISHSSC
jgi:hypothetical protein